MENWGNYLEEVESSECLQLLLLRVGRSPTRCPLDAININSKPSIRENHHKTYPHKQVFMERVHSVQRGCLYNTLEELKPFPNT